jgi:hypothetical protein
MNEWQPIETAPTDEGVLHVRGLWVYSVITGRPLYFDVCAGYLEGGAFRGAFVSAGGDDYGWRPEDYTHWMPLPPEPEPAPKAKEPDPSTPNQGEPR